MTLTTPAIIIADDLTGANDTALQFFKKGYRTKIVIDCNHDFEDIDDVDVWAISTESRNIDKETALKRVIMASETLKEILNIDNFYKKIDSTLRGNTGLEIVAMLEALKKDAVVVAPAYIEEGRTTIGAYQLLEGMVIERTQCALDPKAPIYESYIPDILKKDLNPQLHDLIGTIGFNTITKGAGPIILKLKELIQKGKKIIVLDAASNTDLEQIALAIDKCGYDILPCGSAGLANAINNIKSDDIELKHVECTPSLPRFIVSGSATQLTLKQIQKLKEEQKDAVFIDLTTKDIIDGISENMIASIKQGLLENKDVIVHSSYITKEISDEEAQNQLIDAGIAQMEFSGKITDFLSELVFEVNQDAKFILIMVGGETSFKCAKKIDCAYLGILDAIAPAIPLCMDKYGRIIVTKSGNFGHSNTLVEIIDYFNRTKNENL